jgi:hypothetical protein
MRVMAGLGPATHAFCAEIAGRKRVAITYSRRAPTASLAAFEGDVGFLPILVGLLELQDQDGR